MIFEHEFKVKPNDIRRLKKRNTYPIAPPAPEKSQFYDRQLSRSFGDRFSYEKFINKNNNNEIDDPDVHVLIKKR